MLNYKIYTPEHVVNYLLDAAGYVTGAPVLNKHFMDNSCGNGQILVEAVKRYCLAYIDIHGNYDGLEKDIIKYFHGIEIDPDACNECIDRVYAAASWYCKFSKSDLDIRCANTFKIADEYTNKMDFVVGNPPYMRYHALNDSDKEFIKTLPLCRIGVPDVYIAFFNIGMDMMSDNGVLSYITPSSWISSNSGALFRNKINMSGSLHTIIDFEHEQLFSDSKVTTYSMITVLNKWENESFDYYRYAKCCNDITCVDSLDYSSAFFNGKLYLGTREELKKVKKIFENEDTLGITVKNGFATLCDDVFINNVTDTWNKLPNLSPATHRYVINAIKGSTGENKWCLYPYNEKGELVNLEEIEKEDPEVYKYIMENKEALEKRDYDGAWYEFGRSQGLPDVCKVRVSVNNVVRKLDDLKVFALKPFVGVYSGFYINPNGHDVISKLMSENFIKFVKCLKHYKSGGYYSFTSKEVEKFLNFDF